MGNYISSVISAKAEIQPARVREPKQPPAIKDLIADRIPAFAGMTVEGMQRPPPIPGFR